MVRADGRPAANVPVASRGRAGSRQATTDASGLAFVEATLAAADEARDRCGGIASTALNITAGSGPRAGRSETCIPVDTDAQVRVRALSVTAPGPVTLTLARAASVARAPGWSRRLPWPASTARRSRPSAAWSLTPTKRSFVLPADVPQLVYFRARPLVDGREVRGSFTSTWVRRLDALHPCGALRSVWTRAGQRPARWHFPHAGHAGRRGTRAVLGGPPSSPR
ncbi:MAG: hypothetical protein IPG81_27595 [Sandaracinaceae bacterium]|nr:hypothetical protein [Sandaracinaceae bacterium]